MSTVQITTRNGRNIEKYIEKKMKKIEMFKVRNEKNTSNKS